MFTIKIADLLVEINNRYDEIEKRCKDYIVEVVDREPDICIKTTDAWIAWWIQHGMGDLPVDKMEAECLHSNIYTQLPFFGAVWMHACVVEVGGEGYAFSAPSGYGKSTQGKLWLNYFGANARIINGDNPIIRFINGVCYVCGTPFAGSEGYQFNTKVPLKGICFLNRSEENSLIRMNPDLAFAQLVKMADDHGILTSENEGYLMDVWGQVVAQIPVWELHCNRTTDAVEVAYRGMNNLS